jgi:hypothetical protein
MSYNIKSGDFNTHSANSNTNSFINALTHFKVKNLCNSEYDDIDSLPKEDVELLKETNQENQCLKCSIQDKFDLSMLSISISFVLN